VDFDVPGDVLGDAVGLDWSTLLHSHVPNAGPASHAAAR
jgi:hypothetical protein